MTPDPEIIDLEEMNVFDILKIKQTFKNVLTFMENYKLYTGETTYVVVVNIDIFHEDPCN